MHPARCPEFAHPGIHQRIARPSAPPCPQVPGVVAPGHTVKSAPEIDRVHAGIVVQQVVAELTPAELAEKGEGVAPGRARADCGGDLPGADLAKMQVRRQPARSLTCRKLATFRIAADAMPAKAFEPLLCACLARLPDLPEAAGPVRSGRAKAPTGQVLACGPCGWRRETPHSALRWRKPPVQALAPKGREHPVMAAVMRFDGPGFEQQRRVE